RLVVASTIGRKTRISLFDNESEPCSGSEARRRSRNSAQFVLRPTTISTRNVISSPAKSTNRDAWMRWPNGALSRPNSRLGLGMLCHTQTTCRYSDNARRRSHRRLLRGSTAEPSTCWLEPCRACPFGQFHQGQGDDDTDQCQPTGDVKGVDIAAEHVLCLTCYEPSRDGADSIG